MGAVRHWQALTPAQVQACNAIGTAAAEHAVAELGQAPNDPLTFLLGHQRRARGIGALVAWMGGLQAGILWHRPDPGQPKPPGDLWMGQLVVAVRVNTAHGAALTPPPDMQEAWVYALVSEQDAPNFAIIGWAKGFDLATAKVMRKDHREFRDARELRALGAASVARMREAGKLTF